MRARRPLTATTLLGVAVLMLAGCGGFEPASAEDVITELVAADTLQCDERRTPIPDVVTCEDPGGDVTITLTDDGVKQVASLSASGPFVVGDNWVVISYDDDLERAERFRDALGDGVLYAKNSDGEPTPVE